MDNQEVILERISNGKTLSAVRKELNINPREWWETIQQDPLFAEDIKNARLHACEALADNVLTIADDYSDPQQARIKLESVSKYLGWMDPSRYGNRIDIAVTQTIDIAGAIERATQRIAIDVTPLALPEPKNINDLE